MTREEWWAQVHATRDRFYAGDPLYQAATPPLTQEQHPLMCDRCELPGAPWQWDGHFCTCEGGPVNPVPAMDEYRVKFAPPAPVCDVCAGGGTVMVAVGSVDPFGCPDGTVEAPCPACPAGDAEAQHRIGRPWRTSSSSLAQGPLESTDPLPSDPGTTAQAPSCPGTDFAAATSLGGEERHDTPPAVVAAMPVRAGTPLPPVGVPAHRPDKEPS